MDLTSRVTVRLCGVGVPSPPSLRRHGGGAWYGCIPEVGVALEGVRISEETREARGAWQRTRFDKRTEQREEGTAKAGEKVGGDKSVGHLGTRWGECASRAVRKG